MLRTLFALVLFSYLSPSLAQTIRVATFNVSMEADNYLPKGTRPVGNELFERLASGDNQQIKNIAEIIQRIRPDIILLNEFDYTENDEIGVKAFIKNYLNVPQGASQSIDYSYFYTAPVNTGVDSGLDLGKDGVASGKGDDAFGFGLYPGQYGMVILSRFPIDIQGVRTFQHFLWKDMPGNLMTTVVDEKGNDWFTPKAQQVLRLSSKSHWDIPLKMGDDVIHVLASHPTPPVFDGPENRNGKRNHDEVRFWSDYLSGRAQSAYIYDDNGTAGGFEGGHFVIVGDLNSSADEGDGLKSGIQGLLEHTLVNASMIPKSEGGKAHAPNNQYSAQHTAGWGMRADYVLPSVSLKQLDSEVFWPKVDEPLFRLIKDRKSSSDHRLVWVDVAVTH